LLVQGNIEGKNNSLHVLEDSTGFLSIEDMLLQEPDILSNNRLAFGYSQSAFWIKPKLNIISNQSNSIYIAVSQPTINYVDFYLVRGDSVTKSIHTGTLRSAANREFPFNRFAFQVDDLNPNDRVFIRLQNQEGKLNTAIRVFNKIDFFSYIKRGNYIAFFIFGFIGFQLVFALLQSYLYREKLLYWYCGLVLFILVHQFFNMGYGYLFIPDSMLKHSNALNIAPTPIFMACLTAFAYYLLNVRSLFSVKISYLIIALILLNFFITFLAFVPVPFYPHRFLILTVFFIFLIITVIFLIATAVISLRKGHKPARYYLLVHIPLGFIIFFQLLINYNFIPYHEAYFYLKPAGAIFEVTLSMLLLAYLVFNRYQKKQIVQKEHELQAQKQAERIRIARDMHDEIGAGLTRIVVRSEQIKSHLHVGKEIKNGIVESLEKVEEESRRLSHNIGEIIWALNPINDTLDNLFAYIRNYAYDYLEETDITCHIQFPENIPITSVSPELRRNVFLIVKESLNNLVKHSKATQANITLQLSENHFSITIQDNGTGIADVTETNGNGLDNMKKRTETLGGNFVVKNDNGLCLLIEKIPFKIPTKV
jgi:signal transduction histidine kinase